jgi:hypothetical protein
VFEAASSFYFSVSTLDSSKAIVCYRDNGNSGYGTACVLSIMEPIDGISLSASTNTTASVALVGIADGLSGLTVGRTYYVQQNGTIGLTSSSLVVGKAISTTSLLLKIN